MTDFSIFAQSRLMPGYVEAPSSDRTLDKKTAVTSFLNAPAGLQRAWQRLCINTYRNGGRIFCREIDTENVEAVFRF
jgi:hypothetical protein